jgi:hypothetical protein
MNIKSMTSIKASIKKRQRSIDVHVHAATRGYMSGAQLGGAVISAVIVCAPGVGIGARIGFAIITSTLVKESIENMIDGVTSTKRITTRTSI